MRHATRMKEQATRYTAITTADGTRHVFRTATELCNWLRTAPTADLLQLSMMTVAGAEVDAARERERKREVGR